MVKKRSQSESVVSTPTETGNRFVRADYEEGTEGTVVLYRGIQTHEGRLYTTKLYDEQTRENNSLVGPKKPLDTTISVEGHVEGTTNSPYTSWTPVYGVAKKFADKNGSGTVMKGVFRKEDLIHPTIDFEGEVEYSVLGTVFGAKPQLSEPANTQEISNKAKQQWSKESRELERPSLKDPLTNASISHEYSPTGKVARTWENRGYFDRTVVHGPGTPPPETSEEGRKRSKTEGERPALFTEGTYHSSPPPKASTTTGLNNNPTPPDSGGPLGPSIEKSEQTPVKEPKSTGFISKYKALKKEALKDVAQKEEALTKEEKRNGVQLP